MNKQKSIVWLMMTPLLLVLFMLTGCAAKTAPIWGDLQTGVILQYQMPEGQELKYVSWEKAHQVSEMMGMAIEVDIDSTNSFTVQSKGTMENKYQLTIIINDMSFKIQSVQANLEPDMSQVIGKSFNMHLSPLGKESELQGAEEITYEMGPEGTRSIASTFEQIFPDLAGRPLKIGDTWPDETNISEKTGDGEMALQISEENTLDGFETIDEMECVRILSRYMGTLEGRGQQQGIETISTGDIQGTSTWYFAYKEGVFVKHTSKGTVKGMVDIPSQGIEIPFTRDTTSEIILKKSN
jgi:hypothetical protein